MNRTRYRAACAVIKEAVAERWERLLCRHTPEAIADANAIAQDVDALAAFDELAHRFQGVDLQYRRDANWHGPWRAINHTSKTERAEYRVVAYGATPQEAIAELQRKVDKVRAPVEIAFEEAAKHEVKP